MMKNVSEVALCRLQIVKLFAEALEHVDEMDSSSLFHYQKPRGKTAAQS